MKKRLIVTAVTALTLGVCTLPVHAASSTDVQVGVSKTAIPESVLNVTVPLKVAVALDASVASGEPKVLLGRVIKEKGIITDEEGAGALVFVNHGSEAILTAAKVQNGTRSSWALKNTVTAAYEMSFKVNGSTSAYDISKGMSGEVLDKPIILPIGTTGSGNEKAVPLEVKVGGKNDAYNDENSAQAFRITWTIALNK